MKLDNFMTLTVPLAGGHSVVFNWIVDEILLRLAGAGVRSTGGAPRAGTS
jgi:hypothetical protein